MVAHLAPNLNQHKMFTGSALSYCERLYNLKIQTLEERRIVQDLVFLLKIIRGQVDLNFEDFFQFSTTPTRGHRYQIVAKHFSKRAYQCFFTNRIVNLWNSLPDELFDLKIDSFRTNIADAINLRKYCVGSYFKEFI